MCIEDLLSEFENCFSEYKVQTNTFSLVSDPSFILPEELSKCSLFITNEKLAICQMELFEIQSNDVLKRTQKIVESLPIFWSQVYQKNMRILRELRCQWYCSAYCCEHTFSVMNTVKSNTRNSLITQHTSEWIKAAVTSYSPNFEQICRKREVDPPH